MPRRTASGPPPLFQAGIELRHRFHDPQPRPHRPLGIIFMGLGIAEVDQQAIAEILGDIPVIAGDHLGAGLLIGPHDLAPVFRVELAGEHGRVHQIAEQHGELAAFGLWYVRLMLSDGALEPLGFVAVGGWRGLGWLLQ